MATNTTNFNLKKPAYTDTADIADINGNMDKVDVSLNGLADAIAIVANNNTHAAITAGQYVYVHGHGTLAEGLYKANSNIAANATLTSSNLTADSSGGLNALNSEIATQTSQELVPGVYYVKSANIVIVNFSGTNTTVLVNNAWTSIGTLPVGYRPVSGLYANIALGSSANADGVARVSESGDVSIFHSTGSDKQYPWGQIIFAV